MKNSIKRNCIICASHKNEEIFVFTDEFNDFFDNSSKESRKLNSIYGPQNIVQCKECGCNFVQNVVMKITTNSEIINERESISRNKEILEQNFNNIKKQINNKFYDAIIYKLKIAKKFTKKNSKNISILDYGSGVGQVCKISEIFGFNKIYAYDPVFNLNTQNNFEDSGFKKIAAINDLNSIKNNMKFDIIWCTAVIEHALNPQKIFEEFNKFSHEKTIFLFSNPLMPISKDVDNIKKILKNKNIEEIKKLQNKKKYMHYHLNHINFMMGKQVNMLFKKYNFKVLPIYPNKYINRSITFKINPIMILLKKIYVWIFPYSSRSDYFFKKNRDIKKS